MEPRIQYAKTKDGVRIAYWTLGNGMPFVVSLAPYSHIQQEWQWPDWRRLYERYAEGRMLIRYDGRGCGLSDRGVTDYALDARMSDLEAVVARLGLEKFALLGATDNGPAAIAYAASHPEQVSRLVLWCTWAKTSDPAWTAATDDLISKDWEMGSETVAHGVVGWADPENARRFAAYMRASVTPDACIASGRAANEFDVTDLLARVTSPTLVLHRREVSFVEIGRAQDLASGIPDAQLVVLEGASMLPFLEDMESVAAAVDDFLDRGGEPQEQTPAAGAVRTILFTDLVGHTEMMQRLGDTRGRDVLREHERITRETLRQHGGSEVKTMGDGFLASFGSVTSAVECGIALQRAFAAHTASMSEPLHVRVGLNAGEPIEEDGDLFGSTVILASRIAAQAGPGEILVPEPVRHLLSGKPFVYADRGEFVPKGFDDAVRLYEVRWRPEVAAGDEGA